MYLKQCKYKQKKKKLIDFIDAKLENSSDDNMMMLTAQVFISFQCVFMDIHRF